VVDKKGRSVRVYACDELQATIWVEEVLRRIVDYVRADR
jgi:hypothetical protein